MLTSEQTYSIPLHLSNEWLFTAPTRELFTVLCGTEKFQLTLQKRGKLHRVSQEECARLRESVPYVKLYRYNPKHLYPKLNGYGDNSQRKMWASSVSTYYTPSVTSYLSNAPARQLDIVMQ